MASNRGEPKVGKGMFLRKCKDAKLGAKSSNSPAPTSGVDGFFSHSLSDSFESISNSPFKGYNILEVNINRKYTSRQASQLPIFMLTPKAMLLIAEIAVAPSLPSSFVSLHLSPCMLIPKISLLHLSPFLCLPACWFPKSPPLQLSPFICLPACWFPKSPFFICLPSFVSLHADSRSPCMLITEIAAAPSLSSSFVSLHSPDSWKL